MCKTGEFYDLQNTSHWKLFLKRIPGLGCSLVVQRLPSMREALGLIPAPKKKRQNK
jgi:hypothetical protein